MRTPGGTWRWPISVGTRALMISQVLHRPPPDRPLPITAGTQVHLCSIEHNMALCDCTKASSPGVQAAVQVLGPQGMGQQLWHDPLLLVAHVMTTPALRRTSAREQQPAGGRLTARD